MALETRHSRLDNTLISSHGNISDDSKSLLLVVKTKGSDLPFLSLVFALTWQFSYCRNCRLTLCDAVDQYVCS